MIMEIVKKDLKFINGRTDSSLMIKDAVEKNTSISMGIEERIVDIFLSIGISAHLQGYQYLKEAIKLVIISPECINSVTKQLYPRIATMFSTTPCRVERGIRHALDVAYAKGKIVQLNKIFRLEIFSKDEKPTNSEFIAILADKLSLELK